MHKLFCLLLVIAVSPRNIEGQYNEADITASLNSFAISFLRTITAEAGDSLNVAVSPYTVWALMSIITEGARGNTARQLESVLHLPQDKTGFRNNFRNLSELLSRPSEGVDFVTSNAIFTTINQELNRTYRDTSRNYYKVDVQPTDFTNTAEATRQINAYVAQATRNRIPQFLHGDELNEAQIFLTSALYFKGAWQVPFNHSATNRNNFYDEKDNKVGEVDMMFQMGFFPYSRVEQIRAHAVELPYGNGEKMSMVLILPYTSESIRNVLNELSRTSFRRIMEMLNDAREQFMDEDVLVYLPRFAVKSDFNLNVVMQKMGIKDVFDQYTADLLGMFPHYLYISRLIQRAEIEVNEEGTVASAATGAALTYKSPPPKFEANRPFLYFIVDKPTSSIVFAGKVSNPNTIGASQLRRG